MQLYERIYNYKISQFKTIHVLDIEKPSLFLEFYKNTEHRLI